MAALTAVDFATMRRGAYAHVELIAGASQPKAPAGMKSGMP